MSQPKVLIVEDDQPIRTLLVAAMRRDPLEIHTAADGLIALELVRANEYAVILLDLMLPRVNGFEFLDQLEAVERRGARPITIVMTAFDGAAIKRLGSMRVQAILHKPFDVERVVEIVRDCALLHAEHVTALACKHPVSERSQTAVS
ncbi:MAG TPA: response regulator [Thermoanaerobaculia bacterium]|nr:response regulator [Thermoanaerobaculia bacterium]